MTSSVFLIVGITAVIVVSQFSVRPVRPVVYAWVALLVVRGCVPPGPSRTTAAGIAFLVAGLVVSVVAGVLRGRTMPMWRGADGRLYRKGGRMTLLLWLATVAVKLGLGAIAEAAFGEPFNGNALWLGLGITLGAQHLVMTRLGRRLTAPESSSQPSTCARDQADQRTLSSD
ncbi:hypothetical protein KMT30_37275 [Streptomyces sp. IBSBF 2953]|uniref:hypothetical protein n=1 Tax=Streptomyces TaxID=1883 RepID=UPI00211A7DFC|nr:hypothetical protein [Streptomyces scabiei]MCQ9184596.1 hypothetical protein [Streptomyces hayashii]MDX3118784.1 hypothetical protein [Streptomyces scabiei]